MNVLYLWSLPVHSYVFHFLILDTFLFHFFDSYLFLTRAHPTALDGSPRATELHAVRSFPRYLKRKKSNVCIRNWQICSAVRLTRRSSVGCRRSRPIYYFIAQLRAEIMLSTSFVVLALFVYFSHYFQFCFISLSAWCDRALSSDMPAGFFYKLNEKLKKRSLIFLLKNDGPLVECLLC